MKDFPEEGGKVKASTARKQKQNKKILKHGFYTTFIIKSVFSTSEILNLSQVAEGKKYM